MRTIAQSALIISLAAALLADCGGSQPPIGAPGTMPQSHTGAQTRVMVHRTRNAQSSYKVLYSFSDSLDGADPVASLIDVKNVLYGTTDEGGKSGLGTVFSVSTTGAERVLYAFGRSHHGGHPEASLIDMGGKLYGTTRFGGYGAGEVFSVSRSGRERVLYGFVRHCSTSNCDGRNPQASLIGVNGTLYGTTVHGGGGYCAGGCGTVFGVSTSGNETVLHRFTGYDGGGPSASLIDVSGTLYGTASSGGTSGGGTVFSVGTSGTALVLHNFSGSPDGADPVASLIDVNGTLYGTTLEGGTYSRACTFGCGTVFSISTSGSEKVLYSFSGQSDGGGPSANLIDVNGTLYGTTFGGGAYQGGTVFSISTSGAEQVLHSFGRGSDGAYPFAGLIDVNGTLYGTTAGGGAYAGCHYGGCGTVFALTP